MKKRKSAILFIICIILIGLFDYLGAFGVQIGDYQINSFGKFIKRGLDLNGGVSVIEEIQGKNVDPEAVNRTVTLLSTRVNKLGVSETTVERQGKNRIRINVPGIYDTDSVIQTVAKTGELKFVGPDGTTILTGKDVKDASAVYDQNNQPIISLEFNSDGTKKFKDATTKYMNQIISITMDGQTVTTPEVDAVISDGKAIIQGKNMTIDEAKKDAEIIKSGALPVTLKVASAQVVGASLGKEALPQSIKAGFIALVIIMVFMLVYYRFLGFIADVALALFTGIVIGTFALFGVTLTLAGIAGLLLTIGMAVDANVLMFERIKEELKLGKSMKSAIDAGYHRALPSILDSNISSIIAGIVLYSLGSGQIKGFALTLIIGVILSLFTAVIVTSHLVKLAAKAGILDHNWTISTFGVHDIKGTTKYLKIIEKTKIWFAISLIVIVVGFGFIFTRGLSYSIDFKGGTLITVDMKQKFVKTDADNIIKKYAPDYTTDIIGSNQNQYEIKSTVVKAENIPKLVSALKAKYPNSVLASQDSIGATIGNETSRNAVIAIVIASIFMLVYVGIRFKFSYGCAAILALAHDVLITLSMYAIFNLPISSYFIAAVLTVIGYSMCDTIVVFDRIRENHNFMRGKDTVTLVDASITQTLARSIITVMTVLIMILSIYIFVPAIREFALPLLIGITSGCYSSIFIASPFWVIFKKAEAKKKTMNKK